MLLIFPRYKPSSLREYYLKDFDADLWRDEYGNMVLESPFQVAHVHGTGLGTAVSPDWQPLSKTQFCELIEQHSQVLLSGRRPFSLGVVLSPPKSISIAALAGERVRQEIISAHRAAVNYIVALYSGMMMTRKRGAEVPLEGCVFRFSHPFSRADDPLLHDHLEWIPHHTEGSLHTYPWFFFQHSMRQIYHYGLAAGLAREGFSIRTSDGESLSWELDGVDPDAIVQFSRRSAEVESLARENCKETLSAALRWAALTSSKALPKSPEANLALVRRNWLNELLPSQRTPELGNPKLSSSLKLPSLAKIFRLSSSAHQLTLQARTLALCLGQPCQTEQAMAEVDDFLRAQQNKRLLVAQTVGTGIAYLYPRFFTAERSLGARVVKGMGRGVSVNSDSENPVLAKALTCPNQIRIVCVGNEQLNITPKINESSRCAILDFPMWNPIEVLKEIDSAGDRNLIVLVRQSARTGDFPAFLQSMSLIRSQPVNPRQRIFTVRKGRGRTKTTIIVEVRKGDLPIDPRQRWKHLENRPDNQNAICVVSPAYPEKLRRTLNQEMARRLIFSRPIEERSELIELDEIISWTETPTPGMEVVVLKNHPKFHLGTRWTIRDILADGSLVLAKARVQKTFSREQLSHLEEYFALVQRIPMRIVSGLKLQAERAFCGRKPAVSIKAGEIVVARQLDSDGSLVLDDGRRVPPRFRAFSPAFLVRTVTRSKWIPDTILIQDPNPKKKRAWALSFRARKLIVLSERPESFAANLGKEQAIEKRSRHMRPVFHFVSGAGIFVPGYSSWTKLLSELKTSKLMANVSADLKQTGPDLSKTQAPISNSPEENKPQAEGKIVVKPETPGVQRVKKSRRSRDPARDQDEFPNMG